MTIQANDPNTQSTSDHSTDSTAQAGPASFCAQCGRSLSAHEGRAVGASIYCEPCLAANMSGTNAAGYQPVDPGVNGGFTPAPAGLPNPGLAIVLGFIPGVGAMYNGQYAKGIVHLVVFAVLVSLADANGIFGLFVAGWIAYMVFDAHHTARARRDGTPLPNPFGLNDIGERMGFGRAWAAGRTAPSQPAAGYAPGYAPPWTPPASAPPAAAWGAPAEFYSTPPNPQTAYSSVYGTGHAPYNQAAYDQASYSQGPFAPPAPGYAADPVTLLPPRFPAGAIWLIGLGSFFLLTTSGLLSGFRPGILIGFLLVGLGIWIFVRPLSRGGASLSPDSSLLQRVQFFRACRGGVWLVLIGTLLLLNDFDILRWHRSWPLFLIVLGVLALLERTALNAVPAVPYPVPPYVPPYPVAAQQAASSIVPAHDSPANAADEKGRL